MEIGVGDYVEIYCNEEGYLDSYFVAKVLHKMGRKKFKVEYTTMLDDNDDTKFLIEKVEAFKVRPLPPEIKVSGFDVLDKVDVYDLDVWWVGKVTGMVGCNYSVYFDSSGDELVYSFDELRVHQEYVNGEWYVPSSQILKRV